MAPYLNCQYSRRHLRHVQREHFPEFCVGQGNGKRCRCWYCDRDYVINSIGPGDRCKRTRSTLVVMMNCRPMTMPLAVYVSRN